LGKSPKSPHLPKGRPPNAKKWKDLRHFNQQQILKGGNGHIIFKGGVLKKKV
jgi:hypothetical protein